MALTPGLSLNIRAGGQETKKSTPILKEIHLYEGVCFDIIGTCDWDCHWIYGYEVAGTSVKSRLMRRAGLLLEEDWIFMQCTQMELTNR
ncbi:hypothetical protein [Flexibacterium corallicola]|uniref:hypothetical protein n=1 Tax=Flexibacterium corallicola TaxID=3037259 RepID=UPI00286EB970|nr:hypothetical protein [Pseudovibrio sp. M1P-2-3]